MREKLWPEQQWYKYMKESGKYDNQCESCGHTPAKIDHAIEQLIAGESTPLLQPWSEGWSEPKRDNEE